MEATTDFVNLYIEKILTEVQELTKAKLILQTQIAWKDKTIQEMSEMQNKLQQSCNDLNEKLHIAIEKKNKKLAT